MTLTNFPPNTAITLCVAIFCSGTSNYAGTTDASGALINSIMLPPTTPAGLWTLRATGGGKSATAAFLVY